jgi:hypothetical protein
MGGAIGSAAQGAMKECSTVGAMPQVMVATSAAMAEPQGNNGVDRSEEYR